MVEVVSCVLRVSMVSKIMGKQVLTVDEDDVLYAHHVSIESEMAMKHE